MAGELTAAQALPLISKYESNNANVLNTQGSTASGYYQIINGTWAQFAPKAGISLSQYPTAISAPQDAQTQVATAIYNAQGITPWKSDAPLLTAFYNAAGTQPDALATAQASTTGSGPVNAAVSSVLGGVISPIWELISRGLLLFLGGIFVLVALVALAWQSKTVQVSTKALAA